MAPANSGQVEDEKRGVLQKDTPYVYLLASKIV